MSRSFKVNRHTFEKVPDKTHVYKCTCSWCIDSKTRYKKVGEDILKVNLQEVEITEFKRVFIDDISDIPSEKKACPKQVKIDLTDAKRKIKMKLYGALV